MAVGVNPGKAGPTDLCTTSAQENPFARGTLLNLSPRRLPATLAATSLLYVLLQGGSLLSRKSVMRNWLISLGALVLVAFPVHAQTPAPQHGLKAGYIAMVVTGEVLPGQMDNFRQLATRMVAAVAEEPGTLVYVSGASNQTRKFIT
jgi:hypothetical protein